MSAKPQQMAQSDASDDLIAELAKLMAKDAEGDRPAAPQAGANAPFPIRIPGGDPLFAPVLAAQSAERTVPTPVSPQPVPVAAQPVVQQPVQADPSPQRQNPQPAFQRAEPQSPRPEPRAQPVASPVVEPEPFNFDFGLTPSAPSSPVRLPVASAPQPTPAPVAPAAAGHDSIADLIAAELAQAEDEPAPAYVPPAAVAPAPVEVAPQRQSSAPTSEAPVRPARAGLQAVNLRPAAGALPDRFKISPVFGLGTTPATPRAEAPTTAPQPRPQAAPPAVDLPPVSVAPVEQERVAPRQEPSFTPRPAVTPAGPHWPGDSVGTDPIDEIESLIGTAAHVEVARPAPPPMPERPPASPALRSLATPTMPQAQPGQRVVSPVDETILAAAQATGAEIGWVEADEAEAAVKPRGRMRRERGNGRAFGLSRALAGPLVAVTLLLAAGFGLYWVLGLSRDAGPAPLLTADATPIKEVPVAQPETATAAQSVVFNEIDGVEPGAEEQLVSRDQADLNEVTQVATPEVSEEGLANRKVRTVTVRPDGTIVSGEDSLAGSAMLPVDRPVVPDVPGAESASAELLANAAPASAAVAATPAVEATPAPEPTPAVAPVTAGATVPVVDLTGNPVAGKTTTIPLQRPAFSAAAIAAAQAQPAPSAPVNAIVDPAASDLPMLPPPPGGGAAAAPVNTPVAATQTQAATAATPAPAAAPSGAIGSAPAYVQLASQRSEDEARATANTLVSRFGPLFNGANIEIQRADLGERGIYYRVRVPAASLSDATAMCNNLKAQGGDCVPM